MVIVPLWIDDGTGPVKNPALTTEEWDAAYAAWLEDQKVKSISMRQCRLVLLAHDMLDTVDAAVKQMPRAAQIEWEFASTVDRNNPLTLGLVQLLGLTAEQMDNMFTEASQL